MQNSYDWQRSARPANSPVLFRPEARADEARLFEAESDPFFEETTD